MELHEIKDHLRDGAYIRNTFNPKDGNWNVLQTESHEVIGDIGGDFGVLFEQGFIENVSTIASGSPVQHYKISTSPEFIERENQVVYTYMHSSGILIMCKRNGNWKFGPFNYRKIVKYLNDHEGFTLNIYDRADQRLIGLRTGILIKDITNRCQKEYIPC